MCDDDWEIYKGISKFSDEDEEEHQQQLAEVEELLSANDPSYYLSVLRFIFIAFQTIMTGNLFQAPKAQDFQICMRTERFKGIEILFQPSLVGVEQAGVIEVIEQVLKCFTPQDQVKMASNIHVTVQMPKFSLSIS